jgi:leader peptidase (prepilin peptidase)/N-methyltransferase
VGAALRWPDSLPTAAYSALALAALLAVSLIDWDHKIIPDRITKPGILLAIAFAPVTTLHPPDWLPDVRPALAAWLHAGLGAAVGAGVLLLIRGLGTLILRKEAMGLGDAKLLAFVGALTGPLPALYTLLIACFAGALVGGLRWALTRGRPLRFPLVVHHGGTETAFASARVGPDLLEVLAPVAGPAGRPVRLRMTLPASEVLTDEDVSLDLAGVLESSEPATGSHRWRLRVTDEGEEARALLASFARSRRYVPFGPFLALGGAAVLFWGAQVHWFVTVGYPSWARGTFGN